MPCRCSCLVPLPQPMGDARSDLSSDSAQPRWPTYEPADAARGPRQRGAALSQQHRGAQRPALLDGILPRLHDQKHLPFRLAPPTFTRAATASRTPTSRIDETVSAADVFGAGNVGNLIDSSQAASDGGAGASSSEPAEQLKQLQESNPQHMLVPTEYKVPYRWSRSEIITTSAEDFWAAP